MTTSDHHRETGWRWPRILILGGFAVAAFLIGMSLPFFDDNEELGPRVVVDLPPPIEIPDPLPLQGEMKEQTAQISQPIGEPPSGDRLGGVAAPAEIEPDVEPSPVFEEEAGERGSDIAQRPTETDSGSLSDVDTESAEGTEQGVDAEIASAPPDGDSSETSDRLETGPSRVSGTAGEDATVAELAASSDVAAAGALSGKADEPGNNDESRVSEPPQPLEKAAALPSVEVPVRPTPKVFDDTITEAPDETRPTEDALSTDTPTGETPAEVAPPTGETLAEAPPAGATTDELAPSAETQAGENRPEESPAGEMLVEETPPELALTAETPAESAPAEAAPIGETFAEETPAEVRPAGVIPAEVTPDAEGPVEGPPAGEIPVAAVDISPLPDAGVEPPRALTLPPAPLPPTVVTEVIEDKTDLLTNRATVLRSEPTPEAEILLRIGADEKVLRIEEEPVGGYYFVTHDQGTGWAWANNLRHDPAYGEKLSSVDTGSRAGDTVAQVLSVTNLRAEPIIGSDVIVQLKPGEEVELLDRGPHQGYYRVLHSTGEGWIWGKNLRAETGENN